MMENVLKFIELAKIIDWRSISFRNKYGIHDRYEATFPSDMEALKSLIISDSKPGSKEWKQWQFTFEDVRHPLNRIHFQNGLPKELLGMGFGFKLYRALIEHLGYATSEQNASDDAKRVWQKLSNDPSLETLKSDKGHYLCIASKDEAVRRFVTEAWKSHYRTEIGSLNK